MAKQNNLVGLIIYGAAGLVGYKLATGTPPAFGQPVKDALLKLMAGLKGGVGGVLPPSGGGGGTGGGGTGGGGTRTPPPMDANNFVGPYNGGFVVYVNGVQIGWYPMQETAERAYNAARGF